MILFLDTETTGIADFNKRARDPSQLLIKPDGWTIPKEASDVHKITDEIAAIGIAEKHAAEILLAMIRKSQLLVGHNIQFDKFIARIAMRRFELITDEDDAAWKATPTFCTMREMTNVCQLPGKFAGKFKWPKLAEACAHIGKPLVGAHDALADLRACKEVYFWLKARKV